MHHPIAFGLDRQGRLVAVRSVPQGLACGCACPGYGGRLLAKQGQIRAWYFSHAFGAECVNGAETALHLAAKQLSLDHRSVALPPLAVNFRRQHPRFGLVLLPLAPADGCHFARGPSKSELLRAECGKWNRPQLLRVGHHVPLPIRAFATPLTTPTDAFASRGARSHQAFVNATTICDALHRKGYYNDD